MLVTTYEYVTLSPGLTTVTLGVFTIWMADDVGGGVVCWTKPKSTVRLD